MSSASSDEEICPHFSVDSHNYCLKCGDLAFQHEERKKTKIKKYKSIRNLLIDLDIKIPENIVNKADSLANQYFNTTARRSKTKRNLAYYSVYCAYLEFGEEKDPKILAAEFKIESGQIASIFSSFSTLQTAYTPPKRVVTANSFLEQYCLKLGLSPEALVEPIKKILKSVLEKEPGLKHCSPRTVAAGAIRYYAKLVGIEIPSINFPEKINITETSSSDMCEKIAMIDTTPSPTKRKDSQRKPRFIIESPKVKTKQGSVTVNVD